MQRRKKQFAMAGVLIAGMTFGSTTAFAGQLKIDTQHSAVSFQVTHLMFMKVDGKFREFEGTFEFDDDTSTISNINVTIQAATIDTNVEARDKDLRSHRFFDAEKFPTLTFKSSTPTQLSEGKAQITGTLTMHGVEKEVVLDAKLLGKGKDPWGNLKYGFEATTTINRKDFGMTWNEVLEAGGVMVGDEIKVTLNIEAAPAT
jgi:polyisoprenoid-binding protein YceI